MNNNLTEIVFILDRSGSMAGLEDDTVGGFNAFVEKQKKTEGEALLSALLFSDGSEVIYDRVDIRKVEPMTDAQYRAARRHRRGRAPHPERPQIRAGGGSPGQDRLRDHHGRDGERQPGVRL